MIYYSKITAKGNSSYSYISQQDADAMAQYLDNHGCSNCSNCSRCSDCSYCSNCSRCSYCSNCSRCSDCSNCSYCSNCSRCSDCSNCSGEVIQAGRPNGWFCYGWLKDGKLAIHCGCHNGDKAETFGSAVAHWSNKPDRAEVLAACNYIAEIARQRGWAL